MKLKSYDIQMEFIKLIYDIQI